MDSNNSLLEVDRDLFSIIGKDCEDIIYKYKHELEWADVIDEMRGGCEKYKNSIHKNELKNPKKLMEKLEKFTSMEVIHLCWWLFRNVKYEKMYLVQPRIKNDIIDAKEMIWWINFIITARGHWINESFIYYNTPFQDRRQVTNCYDQSPYTYTRYLKYHKYPFVKIKRKSRICIIQ